MSKNKKKKLKIQILIILCNLFWNFRFMKLESLCVLLVNITPLEIRTNLKIPEFSLVADFFIAL